MVLCEWCGDEYVTPLNVYFAEKRGNMPVVFRQYYCPSCQLNFNVEVTDEVPATDNTRLDNQGGSD